MCGDPYQQNPRENEAGGKYATGIISRCYRYFPAGQIIAVQVDLTVNHFGYFEFRLCEHNDTSTPISQACLDANLLQFADGSTRHYVRERDYGVMTLNLRIPPTVVCTQCVLQWKYHTGINVYYVLYPNKDQFTDEMLYILTLQTIFYLCTRKNRRKPVFL